MLGRLIVLTVALVLAAGVEAAGVAAKVKVAAAVLKALNPPNRFAAATRK